jgi:hypothetical protein
MYQSFPDSYSVPVYEIPYDKRPNTNTRYKNFKQTHFTAGDIEQFYRNLTKKPIHIRSSDQAPSEVWENYNISGSSIQNTFEYIFYKFKKGIFIQIRNGKLETFLPFSNHFFVNEWSDRVSLPEHLKSHPDTKILPKRFWYTNNGLIRFESPINETDTGHCQLKHMFQELCNQYQDSIPDIDFFINKRDFPLLKKNKTEPYHHIWDNENQPLVSHCYDQYAPILSMVSCKDFADIPIPTTEDWTRIMTQEQVFFAATKRTINTTDQFEQNWSRKKSIAVFRGSNTGIGTNIENNPRLKLCHLFGKHPLFDVGITSWNQRYRKVYGQTEITQTNPKQYNFIVKPLTLNEQSNYKYIIHVQGHVQAYRLGMELASYSVILMVESKYKLWYEHLLKPWEHYVPVSEDLSDLEEKVNWCIQNDELCKTISLNARKFYETYLNRKGCMEYLFGLLKQLACCRTSNPIQTSRQKYTKYVYAIPSKPSGMFRKLEDTSGSMKNVRNKILFNNANTKIEFVGNQMIKKQSKSFRIEHESFIGYFCINRILREIPNFNYTYSRIHHDQILTEYIPGQTLLHWIQSPTFNLNVWLFYTMQIMLSIAVAQRLHFFMHNDLCPWNIILHPTKEKTLNDYLVALHSVYRTTSKITPIIIDYDKSSCIYQLQWFEPSSTHLKYSTFQDCICYLNTSIYNIVRFQRNRLSITEQRILLQIFKDTLTDSVYCPVENIQQFQDMVYFLEESHKYAHITFSSKGELHKKTPMDVFKVCSGWYQPEKQPIQSIQDVHFVEYTNFTNNIQFYKSLQPKFEHLSQILQNPLLKNYIQTKYLGTPQKTKKHLKNINIELPLMDEQYTGSRLFFYPTYYLDHINLFLEMIHMNIYSEQNRNILHEQLKPYLNTRKEILSYSKYLADFKLQKNIF